MSEYQYYEFLAVDRPLNSDEQAAVRALSTRARITATSFTNTYSWGNFRGNPRELVEKYYDAHLYVTNWGTHEVMLRIPKQLLDPRLAAAYCLDERTEAWTTGTHLILDLRSDDEEGDWDEYAEDSLAAIIGTRAELAAGDLRALYLGWLSALSTWELEEDDEDEYQGVLEPPVPAGLAELTAPQRALADFLRVDADLLAVAAEASAAAPATSQPATARQLAPLIAVMPDKEKDDFLVRLALGSEPQLRVELLHRLHGAPEPVTTSGRRTAAQLLDAAYQRREHNRRLAERQRAEEAARREQKLAKAREQRLAAVAARGEDVWNDITHHVATKKPTEYAAAVELLHDLHEISTRTGRDQEFLKRLQGLRDQHQRKPAFLRRLDEQGLPR